MAFLMLLGCAIIPALLLSALMDETSRAAKFMFGGWAVVAILVCVTNPAVFLFVLMGVPFVLAGTGAGLGIGHVIKGAIARRQGH
jgi:hypothetical protein